MTKNILFTYILYGQIERWNKRKKVYEWRDGYSLDNKCFPLLTKREAQAEAKKNCGRAIFLKPAQINDFYQDDDSEHDLFNELDLEDSKYDLDNSNGKPKPR